MRLSITGEDERRFHLNLKGSTTQPVNCSETLESHPTSSLAPSMANTTLNLLNEIINISAQLHAQTDAFETRDSQPGGKRSRKSSKSSLRFSLPTRSETSKLFSSSGGPEPLAEELAMIHCDRASDLAKEYLDLYDQAYTDVCHSGYSASSNYLRRLSSRLQKTFREVENGWKQETIKTISVLFGKPRNTKVTHNSWSAAFNHDFVPYLETFFGENPRPSRADKLFLSQKSGMSYKQIHVWFQNRRRRLNQSSARIHERNGKQCGLMSNAPKLNAPGSETTDVESDGDTGLENQRIWSRSSSLTLVDDCSDSFANVPPSSCFPTPYPPRPEDYPFPCQRGDFSMPAPDWRRNPLKMTTVRPAVVDMALIVESFAQLTLGDPEQLPSQGKSKRKYDVMAPFTVRPLPAPLPSLIFKSSIHQTVSGVIRSSSTHHNQEPFNSYETSVASSPPKLTYKNHDGRFSWPRPLLLSSKESPDTVGFRALDSRISGRFSCDVQESVSDSPGTVRNIASPSGRVIPTARPSQVQSLHLPSQMVSNPTVQRLPEIIGDVEDTSVTTRDYRESQSIGSCVDLSSFDLPNYANLWTIYSQHETPDDLFPSFADLRLTNPISRYPNHLLAF